MNKNDIVGVFGRTAIQTPQQIISSFLQEYTIEDVDYFLWVMLRSTLSSQDELSDYSQNRNELIFKYETMREFVAAVYKFCGPKHINSNGFNLS